MYVARLTLVRRSSLRFLRSSVRNVDPAALPHCYAPSLSVRSISVSPRIMASQYKLKGVSSLDLKEGEKQEAEVEGIEDAKVLLVNSLGKVHAVSSKCTHYGAPLKNGVVCKGRLTCPWHGASFNIATGDVEDAPALDPIANFDIVQQDGAVYIKGDESTIKANRKTLDISCKAEGQERVVIVGG